MTNFHVYAFREKINGPLTRAFVCRYETREMRPESYSPGAVEHIVIQARDYGAAKQRGFEFAPVVREASGREVRQEAVR